MDCRKGWVRGFEIIGAAFLLLVATHVGAQVNLAEVDPLEYVNFVRGDLTIENMNQPNEEILYSNPDDKGTVELEVRTQNNNVRVTAKRIRLTSNKTLVEATGSVNIDDGTTSVKSNSAKYWVEKGLGEFIGNAEFNQKLDRNRSNRWRGERMEIVFGDGVVKKIKLSGGQGGIYPEKGQMSRFMPGQKSSDGDSSRSRTAVKPPTPTPIPEATPTPKPLERILAPIAE